MDHLKPKLTKEVINCKQTAKNIAIQLKRAINESEGAADQIKHKFKGNSDFLTCFNVYNFCRKNINYIRESDRLQSAKTIQRILYDKFGDCKHYTTFCCSLLKASGIRVQMRLISQNFYDPEPTHIYCVAYINDKEIIVDPCVKTFNSEAQYKYKYNLTL